ncbi:hypothetical protein, partial [Escherichia coli]
MASVSISCPSCSAT